jgi:hypothetical protein
MSLGLNKRKMSQRGERKVARSLSGRLQPASGALAFAKGDVSTQDFLIERKDTTSASFTVTRQVLDKIRVEANQVGKHPMLSVGVAGAEFVVISYDVFEMLLRGDT